VTELTFATILLIAALVLFLVVMGLALYYCPTTPIKGDDDEQKDKDKG
jgi:hypothetical protein